MLDKLKSNLYLDINRSSADEIFKIFEEQEKVLLTFQSTRHGDLGQIVFGNRKVSFMIDAIKDF